MAFELALDDVAQLGAGGELGWLRALGPCLQSAEEIAATIAWLLSPDAAAITGEAVNASAGQTMV